MIIRQKTEKFNIFPFHNKQKSTFGMENYQKELVICVSSFNLVSVESQFLPSHSNSTRFSDNIKKISLQLQE